MRRGTILWINLSDTTPPEFGKIRPGVIVSNSEQNAILEIVVVVPLSAHPPAVWPLRLRLELSNRKTSYAVIPGIRQVKKVRLLDTIGLVADSLMHEIDQAIFAYLSD